jgi:hypothetical protein
MSLPAMEFIEDIDLSFAAFHLFFSLFRQMISHPFLFSFLVSFAACSGSRVVQAAPP